MRAVSEWLAERADALPAPPGGAYAAEHPGLAGAIRDRKVRGRAGAPVVASGNPGCSLWLAAAGLDVRHPVEIVDQVLRGGDGAPR